MDLVTVFLPWYYNGKLVYCPRIVISFPSSFSSKVEVMRSNVGSRVNAMRDQVERFAERWSQLKPKDDVMEGDTSVCAAALATVKDRKAELQQLMTEWEKLR